MKRITKNNKFYVIKNVEFVVKQQQLELTEHYSKKHYWYIVFDSIL